MEFDWWDRGQDFLADMWRGKATLRVIWGRIRMLPPDSAVKRAVDPHGWRLEHYMLADIFDVLAGANWQRGGDGKAKRPDPYPRPQDVEKQKQRQDKLAARVRQFRELASGGNVTE